MQFIVQIVSMCQNNFWKIYAWNKVILSESTHIGRRSYIQFSSVTQLYLTLFYPMDHSTLGLPVHHQLPEPTQTHVHRVGDTIQPFHPLSSPSPPALNLSKLTALCIRWPNIGVSASTSVLPMNTQDRSPLGGGVMIPSHFMTLK